MRRPVSLPSSSAGATSEAKSCARFSSSRNWFCWSRRLLLSRLTAVTWSRRLSATGPLSAAVPTTRPMARARKTAVRETTWYRKLITTASPSHVARLGERLRPGPGCQHCPCLEQPPDREDQIVPPLGGQPQIRLAHRRHRHRRGHRGDRREHEQQQRGAGDVLPVEAADALGVD